MPGEEAVAAIALKLAGATIGALVSLVFMPPETIRQFLARAGVSIPFGVIFEHQTAHYLGWTQSAEDLMASAALTGFVSWWALGAIVRIIKGWQPKQ